MHLFKNYTHRLTEFKVSSLGSHLGNALTSSYASTALIYLIYFSSLSNQHTFKRKQTLTPLIVRLDHSIKNMAVIITVKQDYS